MGLSLDRGRLRHGRAARRHGGGQHRDDAPLRGRLLPRWQAARREGRRDVAHRAIRSTRIPRAEMADDRMIEAQPYVTDDATGDGWRLMLGDSCERLAEL